MLLHLKAKPGAKKDELTREADGSLKLKIRALPIEGQANKYIIAFLANALALPKSKVDILKGTTNAHKTVRVDASEEYVNTQLAKLLGK